MTTMRCLRTALFAVLLCAACALGILSGPAGAAEEVIKFGAAISLTGTLAREGSMVRDAYDFAKDRLNASGGITVGGKTYRLEMIYYDDKSDTTVAAKLVERLVTTDGVKFILGPFGSGGTFSASSVTEKYRIPMIAPSSTADAVYERGYKYLFGTLGSTRTSWEPFFDMVQYLPKPPKTVAILSENTLFPVSQAKAAQATIEKRGLKVVYYTEFPRGLSDYSSMLARVKSLQPDILIGTSFVNDGIQMTKQFKEQVVSAPIIALVSAPYFKDYTAALGPDANGIVTVDFWAPDMPYKGPVFGSAGDFAKEWEGKFHYTPWSTTASSVVSVLVFKLAIEKAGSVDTEKVTEALRQLTAETFYGRIRFDEKGMYIPLNPVRQIQGEQLVTVGPGNVAAGKMVYPFPGWKR